jgi:hypothetical protein
MIIRDEADASGVTQCTGKAPGHSCATIYNIYLTRDPNVKKNLHDFTNIRQILDEKVAQNNTAHSVNTTREQAKQL